MAGKNVGGGGRWRHLLEIIFRLNRCLYEKSAVFHILRVRLTTLLRVLRFLEFSTKVLAARTL